MNVPADDLPLIILALEHYADYMRATNRDDQVYRQIAERLRRKGPRSEEPEGKERSKKA
jgi:hypothetical protein